MKGGSVIHEEAALGSTADVQREVPSFSSSSSSVPMKDDSGQANIEALSEGCHDSELEARLLPRDVHDDLLQSQD